MKRFVSGLLLFIMLLGSVPVLGVQEPGEAAYGEAVEFLQSIGVLDGFSGSKFEPEKVLTRGEAADIAVRALGYTDERLADFSEQVFWDVPPECPQFTSVNAAYHLKLISGVGDNNFSPAAEASGGQVVKMLVNALGWGFDAEAEGGFPAGYLTRANRLGLLKGADGFSVDEPVVRGCMAQMTYNALNAECLVYQGHQDGEQVSRKGTLLQDYLKIYEVRGIVTENGKTSLYGESTLRENEIRIDDEVYAVLEIETGSLIGSRVFAYYRLDGEDPVICRIQPDNTAETVIPAEDLIGFQNMEYRYFSDGGKEKTITLSSSVNMIYNGKSPQKIREEMYLPTEGCVRLINNNGNAGIDVLMIEDAFNISVNHINSADGVIYDKICSENTIHLNPSDKEVVYEIWDDQGQKTDLAALRSGMLLSVLRSEDGGLIQIYVNSGRAEGRIEAVDMERKELVLNGETFKISPLYDEKIQSEFRAGEEGSLYFDRYGKVAYFEKKSSSGMQYGYLVNAATQGVFADGVQVKLFTQQGKMEIFYLKDGLRMDGSSVKEPKEILRKLSDDSGVKPQVVRYRLNGQGEISVLDLAYRTAPEAGESGDSFHEAYDSGSEALEYKNYAGTFAGRVNIDDNTVVFLVPQERDADDKAFSVVQKSYFINDKGYRTLAYKTKRDQIMADVLVVPRSGDEPMSDTATLALVTEFVTGLDADGVSRKMLQLLHDGVEKTLLLENEALTQGLEKGDVIRFTQNNLDEINLIELTYDRSADKIIDSESHQNRPYNAKFRFLKRGIYNRDGKVMVVVPEESISNPKPEDLVNYTLVTMSKIYVYDTKKGTAKIGSENDLTDYRHGGEDYSRIFFRSEYAQPREIIIYK